MFDWVFVASGFFEFGGAFDQFVPDGIPTGGFAWFGEAAVS
jgi:hypothetical protein